MSLWSGAEEEGREPMIRWGVVGPGAIATGFADAMEMVDGGRIVAVALAICRARRRLRWSFRYSGPL